MTLTHAIALAAIGVAMLAVMCAFLTADDDL
jgi:hypothetical protein